MQKVFATSRFATAAVFGTLLCAGPADAKATYVTFEVEGTVTAVNATNP
jgi:hypothetical protein